MFEIREREVPEQLVLTEQRNLLVHELPGWLSATIDRLMKAAQVHGGVIAPVFVVYHGLVNEQNDGPVEVCVPVSPEQQSSTDLPTRQEPAHREAYARITKAQVTFPEILSAYDAVGQWLGSHGVSMAGSPREVYFADFMAAAPTDEVCDVAFPVR